MYKYVRSFEQEFTFGVKNTLLILDEKVDEFLETLVFIRGFSYYDLYSPNSDEPKKIIRCLTYI